MPDFSKEIEIRDADIQGEKNWYWVKGGDGGFGHAGDGPMRDWIQGHSTNYFKYVKKYDLVVTGGACGGIHVRFYAKKFQKVIAFEPSPRNFHCMVNNCPYDNVVKLNAAMGDICGMVHFDAGSETNIGTHAVVSHGNLLVPMLTIDSLGLEACDLIQLDVEGHERKVIAGAIETIKKFRPVIIGENYKDDPVLAGLGYSHACSSYMDHIHVPN